MLRRNAYVVTGRDERWPLCMPPARLINVRVMLWWYSAHRRFLHSSFIVLCVPVHEQFSEFWQCEMVSDIVRLRQTYIKGKA